MVENKGSKWVYETCFRLFIYDENMSVSSLKQAIKHQLDKFGYISFKQGFGYGKAILGVERKEVK